MLLYDSKLHIFPRKLKYLLAAIEPQKINAALSAVSTAMEGRGAQLGTTMSRFNAYLVGVQPGLDDLDRDIRLTSEVLPVYTRSAPDLVRAMDSFRTTSGTLVSQRRTIQQFLTDLDSTAGRTTALTLDTAGPLTGTVTELRPTAATLNRYAPVVTCFVSGAANLSQMLQPFFTTERGATVGASILNRVNRYHYPQDLPQVRADRGPNCWGLPRVPENQVMPHVDFGIGSDPFTGPYGTAKGGPPGS